MIAPRDRGHALVVGGIGGLGAPTVQALVAADHHLVVVDRRGEDGEAWLAGQPDGVRAAVAFEAVDVADAASVDALAERLRDGGIDIAYLVAMQAATAIGPVWDLDVRQWEMVQRVNVTGTFLLARTFARPMVERGFGRIVTFSSYYAYAPPEHQSAYAAAKGAVSALTRALSVDLSPYGVTVNAVAPGLLFHERLRSILSEEEEATQVARTTVGRAGEPAEIAALVRYFCSEESSFTTGQVFHVNGGVYHAG